MTEPKPAAPADIRVADCHGLVNAANQMPAWLSDISSGVPEVDRLHYILFSALDELSASDDSTFASQFATFVGKVERTFRSEESWMDDLDFAAIAIHQEQHARVLGALHHVHAQVMNGNLTTGRHVVDDLLPQWLLFHISTMDTPFALAMQPPQSEGDLSLQPT